MGFLAGTLLPAAGTFQIPDPRSGHLQGLSPCCCLGPCSPSHQHLAGAPSPVSSHSILRLRKGPGEAV